MRQPIRVTVDPEFAIAYIRYIAEERPQDGSLLLFRDVDGVVRDHTFDEKYDVDVRAASNRNPAA
jgi:hypothetical protein